MPYPYERPPPGRLRQFHRDPAQPAIDEIIARSAKQQRKSMRELGAVQLPRPIVLVATSPTNSGYVSKSLLKAAFQATGTPPTWTLHWVILIDDQYFELRRCPGTSKFHFVQSTWEQSKIEEIIAWSEVIGYSYLTNEDILEIGNKLAQAGAAVQRTDEGISFQAPYVHNVSARLTIPFSTTVKILFVPFYNTFSRTGLKTSTCVSGSAL